MTTEVAAILERARMLGRDEQAELALEIVALLDDAADDPAEVEREWAAELVASSGACRVRSVGRSSLGRSARATPDADTLNMPTVTFEPEAEDEVINTSASATSCDSPPNKPLTLTAASRLMRWAARRREPSFTWASPQ